MLGNIQEGINWYSGATPRSHYKLVVLRPSTDITSFELHRFIQDIWLIVQSLKAGVAPSLGPDHPFDPKGLNVLIGYGHKFFERHDLARPIPEGMLQANRFPQPDFSTSRSVLPGSGIIYDDDVIENAVDEEIVLQVTANSQLAVNRVHVEILKYIDGKSMHEAYLSNPISVSAQFDGFGREDQRSWIDFHDGISNLRKGEERRQVIAIKPDNAGGQDWTLNGTYMVYMRLPINLSIWSRLSRPHQELLVGRTKGSGCPILEMDNAGHPIVNIECPMSGTNEVIEDGNERFREPSSIISDELKTSHVQRANHHRSPLFKPDSRRIYRQGFEFVENSDVLGEYRAGLNFVSFQDDPDRVLFILTQSDWLGNLSFGGNPQDQLNGLDRLITARAAGTFFIPPVYSNSAFPGEEFFPV